ncbi:MAG: zinc ribbon domain-containing protein [Thermoanaerobaculia bacterium]
MAARLHSYPAMRCPECNALLDETAAACTTCGLLLLNVAPRKRRAEDFAGQKRRAADRSSAVCPYCGGEVAPDAPRCRHCSEIIDEGFYQKRAQLLRSRINYASWVAYLFGLAALVVFRPVGVLSIAAGLLLSILYYAIPVDPPSSPGTKKPGGLLATIRRQFKLERVALPIPALRNRKLIFVGTPLVAALIGYSANLFLLQEPVNDILAKNAAFSGMDVSAHYQYWIVPGVVVYDLKSLSVRQTPIDVHTAFLEFAKELKERRYSEVELSYKGTKKFSIDGASFTKLGNEYERRNFDFVLYTFPRLFRSDAAVAGETGRDALLQFHRQWYGEDQMTVEVRSVK